MAEIGVVGAAVMGSNLARNIESKGYSVVIYDKMRQATETFLSLYAEEKRIEAAWTAKELAAKLERPRKILVMIRAGAPVDELLETLVPLLDKGDTVIDGGNSDFHDTQRRAARLRQAGVLYLGMGVSGGEQGALHGPSLMPGGDFEAWENCRDFLTDIAAKAPNGEPCCAYLGADGAGHFTKTVHNGIEYGDMELLCEAYQLMRCAMGMTAEEIGDVFDAWGDGGMLDGYLLSISRDILRYRENGKQLVDCILDVAGQKGTGKWTVIESLELGEPSTVVGEAMFARFLSAKKRERTAAGKLFERPCIQKPDGSFFGSLKDALLAAKIILYAQGCGIIAGGAEKYGWELRVPTAARLWRGGCIIRSNMLEHIAAAYEKEPKLANMMLSPEFAKVLGNAVPGLREVVAEGARRGIPIPAFSSALAYFDGYCCDKLPANLLQAMRDCFGAHGYRREDDPNGEPCHTDWTGRGGKIGSGAYNA